MKHKLLSAVLAVAFAYFVASSAVAALKSWVGGSGNWSVGSNWNGGTVPAAGDIVSISPSDGGNRFINYDLVAPTLDSLTLNLTGTFTNRVTLSINNNLTLSSGFIVGTNGRATLNHDGGAVTALSPSLDSVVGQNPGAWGIYNMSGNASLAVGRDLYVGISDLSFGQFFQFGNSTNHIPGRLILGQNLGSVGAYSLASNSYLDAAHGVIGSLGGADLLIEGNATARFITLNVGTHGRIIVNGGTLRLDSFTYSNAGSVEFNSGTLHAAGPRIIGNDTFITNVLGASPLLTRGKQLIIGSDAILFDSLTVAGGAFKAKSLFVSPGTAFYFDYGVLEIDGGTISGLSSLFVPAASEFRVHGTHSLQITGSVGSRITATGNLTLGNADSVNGFGTQGDLHVGANSVTLLDANDVVFDSLSRVSIGDTSSPGTLAAANGLTLDFGGNLTGFGTVNTPNNAARPLINNGHISGNSPAQPITLPGHVKGVGTFDNVQFTGTFSPGFSPAKVNLGSATYDGTLEIEIGGLAPGSGYDQLNHILGSGTAQLGGTLAVSLLPGFSPAAGNVFEIITAAGGITGTFANTIFPSLGGNLGWSVHYGANSVTASVAAAAGLPGDYNNDGVVDGGDYVRWRNHLGDSDESALHNNGDGGGVSLTDYTWWKQHYGSPGAGGLASRAVPGPGPASAVPEPASLFLALLALVGCRPPSRHSHPTNGAMLPGRPIPVLYKRAVVG